MDADANGKKGYTIEEKTAAAAAIMAVAEVIQSAGPNGVPNGHLYAALMSKLSIGAYNRIIQVLIDAKLVKLSDNLLTYIGPIKLGGGQ